MTDPDDGAGAGEGGETGEADEDAEPAEPVGPTEPAESSEPEEHAEPSGPAEPAEPTGGATVAEPTLATRDVTVRFGALTVLEEVSLAFDPGSLTAIAGPNGSGKTTLLELLAGLRAPRRGTVERPSGPGRTVAYLPQTPQFRGGFTVYETLSFYADLVEDDVDPTERLERVGLAGVAHRRVEALSGGMTRLLGLAQALVGDPPVVLLDEPTTGLDPDVADHIFDVVAAMAADGRTVVITSHDLAVVEQRADRLVTIVDGGVALDDAPSALLEATEEPSLRAVFSAAVRGAGRAAVDVDAGSDGGDGQ